MLGKLNFRTLWLDDFFMNDGKQKILRKNFVKKLLVSFQENEIILKRRTTFL